MHVEKSHEDDITGLKFSSDGQILLSRSTDDTLKVFGFNLLQKYFLFYKNILMDLITLATSCMKSHAQVWDLRQMKKPLQVFEDLPNHYAQTNVALSPDEELIFTGTSVEREGSSGGMLCFYDRKRLQLVSRVGISPACSVVQCLWHGRREI